MNHLYTAKTTRLGRFLAVALILSGCTMVGPDFIKPEGPVAGQWLEVDHAKITSQPAEHSDWWTVFDDPVLDSLVDTAYQQNLSLRIAGIRILEARANLGFAVGTFYPQPQQLSADISANQLSDNAPQAAPLDKFFYNHFIGFDAAWELDFWGRFRRGIESADAQMMASIANYDDVLVSLMAEVARTYVLIRTSERRLELARENVKIQRESLRIAEVRFRNGVVTELDVAQARALLPDTQALIPVLETQLRQANYALSTLLGMPPTEIQELRGGSGRIPTPPTVVAVGIPAELLRRRPDIRRAELQAAAKSARIGVAASELYPRISVLGSIGLQSSDAGGRISNDADFSDLFSADSLTYMAGPSLRWPILNYGRLKNNVRVEDARFQQLVVNYQNTVLEAAREVEAALIAFLRAQDQVRSLVESVEAAQRSVELSLIQYRAGAVDYVRVLSSQDFLVQQQDRLAATQGDVALSLIATYKALGGGWQIRQGKEFLPAEVREVMASRTDWSTLLTPTVLDVPPPTEAAGTVRRPVF